jgi:hypothetical protein
MFTSLVQDRALLPRVAQEWGQLLNPNLSAVMGANKQLLIALEIP